MRADYCAGQTYRVFFWKQKDPPILFFKEMKTGDKKYKLTKWNGKGKRPEDHAVEHGVELSMAKEFFLEKAKPNKDIPDKTWNTIKDAIQDKLKDVCRTTI